MRPAWSCPRPSPLASLLLLALACGSPSPAPAKSAPPEAKPRTASAAPKSKPEATGTGPAGWNVLVENGDVWARPELDRYCDAGGRAYFVRTMPATSYEKPEGPAEFGCEPRFTGKLVEVGEVEPPCGAQDVAGQTFCCPGHLRSPELPISGGVPTCRQALYDYLHEQGIDPRVTHPETSGSRGPSFDEFSRVLGRGRFIDQCDVDPRAAVEVCVAVRNGEARGVTVCVQPSDREVGECIARTVRSLDFPKRERLDLTETAFDPRKR